MSIKSQRNNLDLPNITIAKQRAPNYIMNGKGKSKKMPDKQIDNISDYVDENMAKTVKPRHGEKR